MEESKEEKMQPAEGDLNFLNVGDNLEEVITTDC